MRTIKNPVMAGVVALGCSVFLLGVSEVARAASNSDCNFVVLVYEGTMNALPGNAPGFGCPDVTCDDPPEQCEEDTHENLDGSISAICKCGPGWPFWCKGKYTETWDGWTLTCFGICDTGDCPPVPPPGEAYDLPPYGMVQALVCKCQ